MNRRKFLQGLGALGVAVYTENRFRIIHRALAQARPNIVLFFVDDMGWQDTSEPFYKEVTELNRRYHTPNMERLADDGMKFTQAYACPLCSPSRVSLMTGFNAARHRVTNWTLRKDTSPDPDHGALNMPEWNVNGLSPVPGIDHAVYARTLPMFLREAGYRTIHAGKAHWGAAGTPGADPTNLGFDVNIAGHAAGGPGSYHGLHDFSAAWRDGDRIWDVPGLEQYHGQDIYLTEALTLEANKAIDAAVADNTPFYLYMSHYAVHAPWEQDNRYYDKYAKRGSDKLDATYATMIEGMDKSLGDIRANLKRHGIENNTIILFMSDNGAAQQVDRNLPLRGHKLDPYEGGIRVPMMAAWPGVTEPGSVCDQPIIIEDLFPTILELAGVHAYTQVGGPIDGKSIVPLLRQTAGDPEDRTFVWHFPHCYGQQPYSVIRHGDWKLIYFHHDQHYELYNIVEDISETRDLVSDHPGMTKRMAIELGDLLRDMQALMPTYKDSGDTVPLPGTT